MVVVIQVGDRYLGLCVQQVDDIEWHDPAKFYSPSQELFSSTLLPFVRGYLMADTAINCQRSIVLDASAILHAPLLNIHQSK
jgi:chemotaxis signal transduction protein